MLGLHPELAPYKVAVLPLLKKRPEIVELARKLRDDLAKDVMAVYDDTAAIGKLYRRQDEIGTPWCVTVDVDSLEDGAVTIRDRDAMTQERVPVDNVKRAILDRMAAARGYRAAGLESVPRSAAFERFMASTDIDFERWHDGMPYDLAALAEIEGDERAGIEPGCSTEQGRTGATSRAARPGLRGRAEAAVEQLRHGKSSMRLAAARRLPTIR